MSVTSLHVLISLQFKEKVNLKPGGLADGSIYLGLINMVLISLCSLFLYLLCTGSDTGSVNFILKSCFFKPEFVHLSPTGVWGWIMLCGGGCPVHRDTFTSIPGVIYPLDAGSTLLTQW